jgi:plastocyanin
VAVRDLRTGRLRRIPLRGQTALDPQPSAGARVVAFTAAGPGGTSRVLAWDRARGRLTVVAPDGADPSISADGRRVAFSSRAEDLDPAKSDDSVAVFVRELATSRTRLVSAPSAVAAPAPRAAALPTARPVPGAAATVAVRDNRFGERRVAIEAGSVVAWSWASGSSHNVTALDRGFGSATQRRGSFRARLTQPGVYRFACSLHAPGMRMTVVVR